MTHATEADAGHYKLQPDYHFMVIHGVGQVLVQERAEG